MSETKTLAVRVRTTFADSVKAAAKDAGMTQSQFIEGALRGAMGGKFFLPAGADASPPADEPTPTTTTRMHRYDDGFCQVSHPVTAEIEITGTEERCRELAEEYWPGIELDVVDVDAPTTTKTRRGAA